MTVADRIQTPDTAQPKGASVLDEHLPSVERWVLGFAGALVLASIVSRNPRAEVGALCGAALSLFNVRVIAALGKWAKRGGPDDARRRMTIVLALFQVKLFILAALLYLILTYLPAAPIWLVVGLSLLPLGICARAIEYRPSKTAASQEPGISEGERATHNHG